MTTSRRSLALVVLVALAGCGGDSSAPPPRLDPSVAERLAAQSEAVAAALDSGDDCAAARNAQALRAETEREAVPVPIRREILRALAENEPNCAEPPPPPQGPVVSEPDEDDDQHNGKRKKDKKHGHDDEEEDED